MTTSFRTALLLSTSVWNWVHTAGLEFVEGSVLLALSDCDEPVDAIEISAQSRLSLDDIYPALNKLTGRGFAREEHRLHVLTQSGRELVEEFGRYVGGGSSSALASSPRPAMPSLR